MLGALMFGLGFAILLVAIEFIFDPFNIKSKDSQNLEE